MQLVNESAQGAVEVANDAARRETNVTSANVVRWRLAATSAALVIGALMLAPIDGEIVPAEAIVMTVPLFAFLLAAFHATRRTA